MHADRTGTKRPDPAPNRAETPSWTSSAKTAGTRILLIVATVLCAAPPADAGGWARKTGSARLQLSWFALRASERFATGGGLETRCLIERSPGCFRETLESGVRMPVFNDLPGSVSSRALFASFEIGLLPGLQANAQIGYFKSSNEFGITVPPDIETGASGFSDLYLALKYQYLSWNGIALAVQGGYKAPVGEFNRNAFGVSLGEGNRDYDLRHEAGWSLWPLPVYLNAMVGYRWRERNEADIQFGNEWLFQIEAGVRPHQAILLKAAIHGLDAAETRQFLGIGRAETPGRRIVFLSPSLFWTTGPWQLEAGIEYSLAGRNYVRGTKLLFGLARKLELF